MSTRTFSHALPLQSQRVGGYTIIIIIITITIITITIIVLFYNIYLLNVDAVI